MRKSILFLALVLVTMQAALAGGYRVALQGVRQIGMGHTGVGLSGDASALYFNPGALTEMDTKWSFVVGGNAILSTASYSDPSQSSYVAKTNNPVGTPVEFYGAYKVNDRFTVGFGVYTPFGSTVDWGDDWQYRSEITRIELKSYFFQPTIAYKINNWLSFGAGFTYATGSLDMQKYLGNSLPDVGMMDLSNTVSNYGYNLGIYLKPFDQLSIGVDYRSRVQMNAQNGDVTVDMSGVPAAMMPVYAAGLSLTPTDHWDGALPLPAELTLGAAYNITERWLVSMDMTYAFWSTYKDLTVDFYNYKLGNQPSDPTVSVSPRDYVNVMTFRVGTEYKFCDKFTGRAGFFRDPTPSPAEHFSPETPTCTSNGYSIGGSYTVCKGLKLEAAYLCLRGESRYVNNTDVTPAITGDFNMNANVFSFGINYGF